MRALLDANLLITYLLTPNSGSAAVRIVREGMAGAFRLLMPQEWLSEVAHAVAARSYLADRIDAETREEFLAVLPDTAELLPPLDLPIPAVARGPRDDCLLAYAIAFRADVLVTGDCDLLVLRQADDVLILSPGRLLEALAEAGRL